MTVWQDPDGKKFDRVSRLQCHSESYDMDLLFDVNTQLYPLGLNQRFSLLLAASLREDGSVDDGLEADGGCFLSAKKKKIN